MNFNFKKGRKRCFFKKSKLQYLLSQWEECVYVAQWWKKRCEFMFVQTDGRTLILKMVEREVFLMKPKLPYLLSQWQECFYGAQSWKEKRLLCESVFVQIDGWTLALKMVERELFLVKPKQQYHLSRRGEVFMVPDHKKKKTYYVNKSLSKLIDEL